jgi:hypothetical protein
LPGLVSSHDPPDLCLLSSEEPPGHIVYVSFGCKTLHPSSFLFLLS